MSDKTVPIGKVVVDIFAKEPVIHYAKHENGSTYICNGHYMLKTSQEDMDNLIERINNRRRSAKITAAENPRLLDYVDKIRGKYELSKQPYEWETPQNAAYYIFADDNRYYGYNKRYVDTFNHSESRLFINDNESNDVNNHSIIVKSRDNEVLGVVLPIRIPETLLEKLTKDYPIEAKRENGSERAKENPFTYPRQSPWGEVQACEKLCPGVFMVSAEKQGGIMVARDMTAAFSPAALKCGVKYNDHICFEDNGAKDVALRELLDKKLLAVPGGAKDKTAYEENINKSLRERQPQYWRSRENRQEHAPPVKNASARDER